MWVQPDPVVASILFAGSAAGLFRSQDGGQTWALVYPVAISGGTVSGMAVDPANHLHLVFTLQVPTLVETSLDGGDTWTAGNAPNAYVSPTWPQFDPFGSGAILLNGANPCISTDGGHTFTELGPAGGGSRVASLRDAVHQGWIWMGVAYGILGELYVSTDLRGLVDPKLLTRRIGDPVAFGRPRKFARRHSMRPRSTVSM